MQHSPGPFNLHIHDPLLGERVILSLAVTTPMGAMIADMTVRILTTVLVTVLTSLAVSSINALIRRVQRRWGDPPEDGAPGSSRPPENRRASGPVKAEEPEEGE